MKKNAMGILTLFPSIDLVGVSPYTRAQQTLKVLKQVFPKVKSENLKALEPGSDKEGTLEWLRDNRKKQTLALIGHEPHLSELAGFLCNGSERPILSFSKGGICSITFQGRIDRGRGKLECLLTPSSLRLIGKSI